jgi:hypothetical protein
MSVIEKFRPSVNFLICLKKVSGSKPIRPPWSLVLVIFLFLHVNYRTEYYIQVRSIHSMFFDSLFITFLPTALFNEPYSIRKYNYQELYA